MLCIRRILCVGAGYKGEDRDEEIGGGQYSKFKSCFICWEGVKIGRDNLSVVRDFSSSCNCALRRPAIH